MIETALQLDPVSPSLRVVHATVLVESGGLPQAVQELEAAIQLRPDGPRRLSKVQLTLAQAGMLEASGEQAAADAQFAEANRVVVDVIDAWPRYGRAHLALATVHLGLGDDDSRSLWFIFADRTSGRGTYGAGRFLYSDGMPEDGKLVVDFNKAYNPPCAFNEYSTCPLPPQVNRLNLRVTAGEKDYHAAGH